MRRTDCGGVDGFRLPAAFLVIAIHTAPFADVSPVLDTALTYGIGRVAVPFFLMITGCFVLAPYEKSGFLDKTRFRRYLKKTMGLYGASALLYAPVMWYAGKLPKSPWQFLKMLVFDGTYYHLWYFPAVILGCLLTVGMLRRLSMSRAFLCAGILYFVGLLGDSYYGAACAIPLLRQLYDLIFLFSDYTRNGIFYAPLFLLLGRKLAGTDRSGWTAMHSLALAVGLLALMGESILTAHFQLQRHNSMYLTLPAVMYLLFWFLLTRNKKVPACIRDGTLFLYIIHPLVILVVRLGARSFHLERLLVEQSLVHYLAVCLLSVLLTMLYLRGAACWRFWISGRMERRGKRRE